MGSTSAKIDLFVLDEVEPKPRMDLRRLDLLVSESESSLFLSDEKKFLILSILVFWLFWFTNLYFSLSS